VTKFGTSVGDIVGTWVTGGIEDEIGLNETVGVVNIPVA
jgi:hypothetical protein